MSDGPPPAKRKKCVLPSIAVPLPSFRGRNIANECPHRYNLTKSFDVLVGKEPEQQRFTVYHDLLTQRSEFFRAARSERWSHDPTKPTTLDDVTVEVFSAYLHCVNFGAESLDCLVQSMKNEHYWYIEDDEDDNNSSEDGDSEGDDGDGDGVDHGVEQREALLVVEGRRLAGGAGEHQPVVPVRLQMAGQLDGDVEVELAVGVERGDHRRENSAEVGHRATPERCGRLRAYAHRGARARMRTTRKPFRTDARGGANRPHPGATPV